MFDNRQSRGEIYPLLPTGTGKLLELFAGSRSVGNEAEAMGMAEKGYLVVEVERPAWITMKSGNSILHSYTCIFESDTNYFTGE